VDHIGLGIGQGDGGGPIAEISCRKAAGYPERQAAGGMFNRSRIRVE